MIPSEATLPRASIANASIVAAIWFSTWFSVGVLNVPDLCGTEFGVSRRTLHYTGAAVRPVQPNPPDRLPQLPAAPPPAYASPPGAKIGSQSHQTPQIQQQVQQPQTPSITESPLSNVVRLVAFESSGQSFGSGAYVGNFGEYGLVLSNWHVICEAEGLVHVHFSNGFASYGAILIADKTWDLALIAVSKPPQSVPLLPVARSLPRPGDPLWIAGYGPGEYRSAGGYCVRYLAPEIPRDGSSPLYEIIEISVSARQGDSGGPILNANGELAGVLFGSDMVQNTAGSGCERVNRFLSQAHAPLNALPSRPEEHFARFENGQPKRTLLESRNAGRNAAITTTAPLSTMRTLPIRRGIDHRADVAGSATTFGVRSESRRYVHSPMPTSAQPVK